MIRQLLDRLDDYGTDDPGFREGHPEDRCPVCEWPVSDHPGQQDRGSGPIPAQAKWPHRRAAAFALLLDDR